MSKKPQVLPIRIPPTKLCRPPIDDVWVTRTDLLTRLNKGLSKRATLLCAPAGYAKSTVAAQWLTSLPQCSTWLSLDRRDRKLDVFLGSLLASLTTAWPDFGPSLHQMFRGPELPPADYLADAMIEAVAARQTRIVIALDDFHLAESPTVSELIVRCCEMLPEWVHWVILTRELPSLPIALWQTRGWLNEFNYVDLRFSLAETTEFFSHAHLEREHIDDIQRRTDGWPAGLRMFEICQSQLSTPLPSSKLSLASEPKAMEYLTEQVLAEQPAEIREFFGLTAGLDRFCAALCDELRIRDPSSPSSHELIREISRRNLFVFPLDERDEWYRYHPLFRELLVRRQHELLPDIEPHSIFQRADEWCARHDVIEAPPFLLTESGDVDSGANLSNRELDVLLLMKHRLSNKEIAARLHIAYDTVKNHAKNIFRKLGVNSRRQAITRAISLGLDLSPFEWSNSANETHVSSARHEFPLDKSSVSSQFDRRASSSPQRKSESSAALEALHLADAYQEIMTPAANGFVLRALTAALNREPENPLLLAAYADICLDSHKFQFQTIERPMENAICALERAIAIAPDEPAVVFQHALMAMAHQDLVTVRELGTQLISRYGNESSTVYRGVFLLSQVTPSTPMTLELGLAPMDAAGHPGWLNHAPFLDAYQQQEYEAALVSAMNFGMPHFFWGPLERAATLAQLGMTDIAKQQVRSAVALNPDLEKRPRWHLGHHIKHEDTREHVLEGLVRAGLKPRSKY